MTDLVFLLLIFFILASTLVTSSALDIILPKSGAQTVKKKNITLTVNEDLEFDVNGTIVSYDQVERTLLGEVGNYLLTNRPWLFFVLIKQYQQAKLYVY